MQSNRKKNVFESTIFNLNDLCCYNTEYITLSPSLNVYICILYAADCRGVNLGFLVIILFCNGFKKGVFSLSEILFLLRNL